MNNLAKKSGVMSSQAGQGASVPQLRPADNPGLSPQRAYRETPDVVKATARLIRAVGKRVAVEDTIELRYLLRLDTALEEAWLIAVTGLRRSGYTDRQIGIVLGTTKQAVQKRWPR
jgi:hypothetical protein